MTMAMARRRRLVALVAGPMLALLIGCSAAGSSAPAGAPEMPSEAPVPGDGSVPEAPDLPGDRQIARSATVTLEVGDVELAATELRRVAVLVGGAITSESVSLPTDAMPREYDTSLVVLTVPSERLDQSLTLIAGLGEVRHRAVESIDVTDTVVDVDTRVKTMRESIARLQELMARAGSISDIARVEAELTDRQAELEALLARQKALQQQVATSPIAVTLWTAETAQETGPAGFLAGLESGWGAMVTSGVLALTVVGALVPWLVLAGLVTVPILLWQRRRRMSKTPPMNPPQDVSQTAGTGAPGSPPGH